MMTFEKTVIDKTVNRLINGQDYRNEVVNAINATFFDYSLNFFKKIVEAKINSKELNLNWYKENFINSDRFSPDDCAIFAGINKKTITNIYGTATKEVVLDVANENFEYLSSMIEELDQSTSEAIGITIKLCYHDVNVELNLAESLLVINVLATKKAAIRGGAWSSIGKKVEKPLINKLCKIVGVPRENIDDSVFVKNDELDYDREIDFILYNTKNEKIKVEVKLMGRGNPESADVIFARDTKLFVADTLSEQNKNQFKANNVQFVEMKGNKNVAEDFAKAMKKLKVPINE